MTSEAVGIDSESLLFAKLQEHKFEIPNLISRRLYNDRRKITSSLCNTIRERMAKEIDGDEDCFCIDSKPIEVCRFPSIVVWGRRILRKHRQSDTAHHKEYIITDINSTRSAD